MEVTVNNNGNAIIIKGTHFSTYDYKGDKFNREVQRKSVSIDIDPEAIEMIEQFGLQHYTVGESKENAGQNFIIAPFSATTTVYDTDNMFKYRKAYDQNEPNFEVTDGSLAITKSKHEATGKYFYRVSVIKVAHSNVHNFQTDYFGDDDKFASIEASQASTMIEG